MHVVADPAIQACHRMHVVADGDVVLRVTVWPAGSVAPEDVPHVTSLWTARATVALFLIFVTAPVLRGGEGMCRVCGVVAGAETTGFVRVCLFWARENGNAASARVQWRLQKHPSY